MSFEPLNATKIVLSIFDEEYPVISYNISFNQNHNANTGDVVGEPIGGLLDISVISNGEPDFLEWMKDVNEEPKSGEIEFYSGSQLLKSIEFEDAHLIGYNQNMDEVTDTSGNRQRVISEDLSISWKSITIFDVEFAKGGEE